MLKLESLERGTPEFQELTLEQQEARRKFLKVVLGTVVESPSALGLTSLGLTKEGTAQFVCDFLEFHLTGRIERFPETLPNRKRKK